MAASEDGSSSHFSCDHRIGVSFIAQSACLSCVSVISLLSYVAFRAYRPHSPSQRNFVRSHLDLYLLGLLIFDLIQAVGGIMDIRWISLSGVFEGQFCTVQGVLEQFGDVGVALCSLTIAVHTFAEIVFRWKEPRNFKIPIIVLSTYVVFLTLIVGVGYATHRHSDPVYYGNTVYWCWIRKEFLAEGIGLEYLWLWIAAATNLLLYVPIFLVLQHIMVIENTRTSLKHRIKWTTKKERQEFRAAEENKRIKSHRMLFYPAVYIVTVLPIAVARIHSLSGGSVPFPATVFSGMLFSASGFFNVVVYTVTRPTLLRPTAHAAPKDSGQPNVFFYADQSDIDAQSIDMRNRGERTPTPYSVDRPHVEAPSADGPN